MLQRTKSISSSSEPTNFCLTIFDFLCNSCYKTPYKTGPIDTTECCPLLPGALGSAAGLPAWAEVFSRPQRSAVASLSAAVLLSGLNSKSLVVTTKWTKSSTAPWFQYLWEILDVRLTCEFKGSEVRKAVSVLRIIISGIFHRHVIDVQIRLYLSGSQSCLCRCLLYPPPRKKRRNYILIYGTLTYSIIKHIRNYMFYKWVLSSMINLLFHIHG